MLICIERKLSVVFCQFLPTVLRNSTPSTMIGTTSILNHGSTILPSPRTQVLESEIEDISNVLSETGPGAWTPVFN
jgi:hypothetical protein